MSFLPEAYEVPQPTGGGGRYFRPQDGENRVRILTDCIVGWLYWTGDNKPVRLTEEPKQLPPDIRMKEGKPDRVKHFWATVVYNCLADDIAIWEITQSTIQNAIAGYARDADWGHPRQYDLKITRSGKDLQTEYQIIPGRISEVPSAAVELFNTTPIDLNLLYSGGDPFSATAHSHPLIAPKSSPMDTYKGMLSRAADDPDKLKLAHDWALGKMPDQADEIAALYAEALDKADIPF